MGESNVIEKTASFFSEIIIRDVLLLVEGKIHLQNEAPFLCSLPTTENV